MNKLFSAYLKGAYSTPFSQGVKEGYALQLATQLAAAILFPAAPRRLRVLGAYAAATAAATAVLVVRGAREERPLEVLVAESNRRVAKGIVSALHTAQGWAEALEDHAEALGVVLGDARRGIAAAGGVSPLPDAYTPVAPPVNTRRAASSEN